MSSAHLPVIIDTNERI